jgi:hypothetical protein
MIIARVQLANAGLYECKLRRVAEDTGRDINRKIRINVLEKSVTSTEKFDYDEDESEEEKIEKAENRESSCELVEAALSFRNESYICIDLNNKKEMSNFLVKSTGTTATLYCHARGTLNYCKNEK